jgi:hypothetical protein
MPSLRRIWNDLRKGENIDLYLTIAAAVAFVALNLAGSASTALLAPLTLAVLALLAITSLGNRHRMDELLTQRERTLDDFFLEQFPPSYKADLEAAKELWLVGVSLHRTVTENYPLFERKLQRGHRLRVLLVHPDGPGLEMAVARGYTRRDVEKKRQEIRYVLDMLCDLRQAAAGRVEIRTIQHPLAYGALAADPEAGRGALYLEHYCFRVSTESMPRYQLRVTDGHWYDFFKAELKALWAAGVEWNCVEETK